MLKIIYAFLCKYLKRDLEINGLSFCMNCEFGLWKEI